MPKNFLYFFLIACPQTYHIQSKKLNFLLKFCAKTYFAGIISIRSTIYEKKEGSGAGSGSIPPTNGSGRPKTCGSCGSGSTTLEETLLLQFEKNGKNHHPSVLSHFIFEH
jgi:hypothetical protein